MLTGLVLGFATIASLGYLVKLVITTNAPVLVVGVAAVLILAAILGCTGLGYSLYFYLKL